jgi:ABC-type bacteriocin/lantibiotic exporter with double-glycine peptidase domain
MSFFFKSVLENSTVGLVQTSRRFKDTLTSTIAEFLRQFILIIGGVALLATESIKLTLLMLSVVPLVAVAAVIFGRFIRKYSKNVQDQVPKVR